MPGSSSGAIPPERLVAYDRLIALLPDVQRKGAKLPYTSVNGHMFSFLGDGGALALRLPPAERDAFVERFGARLHEAHGTVMKEYVTVPDSLLDQPEILRPYLEASHAWVASLKPKPTTRKRA
jgi:TfoX/Sxy family transcriptional regulator of competence genes